MKVTVGICAFNEAHPIGACLQSLLLQRISPDFELIEIVVVASGCTDGTERVVREWQDRDPRILLVHEPQRRGKASGLNEIFRRAQREINAILNADAVLPDDAMTELLLAFPWRFQDPCTDCYANVGGSSGATAKSKPSWGDHRIPSRSCLRTSRLWQSGSRQARSFRNLRASLRCCW